MRVSTNITLQENCTHQQRFMRNHAKHKKYIQEEKIHKRSQKSLNSSTRHCLFSKSLKYNLLVQEGMTMLMNYLFNETLFWNINKEFCDIDMKESE